MNRSLSILLGVAATVGACRSSSERSQVGAAPSSTQSASVLAPSNAEATLDRMDSRKPVPLLPMMADHQKQNMREHLVAVQQIVAAAAANDFDAIEKASKLIGYSELMGQMCTHMGAGAPGFTERALAFHRTADTIGTAARSKDVKAVLTALTATLGTCTSCHATFKQRVVDEAGWAAAVPGAAAPPAGMHGTMHPAR